MCVTHTPGLSTEDIADFALALLLATAGCGDDGDKPAESARAPGQKARDDDEIKTPIVRSLLDTLDEIDVLVRGLHRAREVFA